MLLCLFSGKLWTSEHVKSKCSNCKRVEVLVNSQTSTQEVSLWLGKPFEGPHQHGEQPSVRGTAGPQVVCRMRGEDRRPLPALLHGALLAHSLPQVLLLPSPAGRHWHHLLQQRGHDSVSERLHQTVRAQRGMQRLRPVNPSQRDGDEGTGKCLPPQVFQLCHL